MACYKPVPAVMQESGVVSFRSPKIVVGDSIRLPCRNCVGCKLDYARMWAIRCTDESMMHKRNSFVTLTYDDSHLPKDGWVDRRAFPLFMKRLRRFTGLPIRYFHAAEYGTKYGRPHYHGLLFGVDFPDRVPLKNLDSGSMIYTSKTLQSVWPMGYSSVGDVTPESTAYVARYCTKKYDSGFFFRGVMKTLRVSCLMLISRLVRFVGRSL